MKTYIVKVKDTFEEDFAIKLIRHNIFEEEYGRRRKSTNRLNNVQLSYINKEPYLNAAAKVLFNEHNKDAAIKILNELITKLQNEKEIRILHETNDMNDDINEVKDVILHIQNKDIKDIMNEIDAGMTQYSDYIKSKSKLYDK